MLALAGSARADVIFVDAASPPGQNGLSWAQALPSLQEALDLAQSGTEIRVAGGHYLPDKLTTSDPRSATFALAKGVLVRGGFAGAASPNPDQQDFLAHPSLLDGDIGLPLLVFDNSLHVVTAVGLDATAVLEGFTILNGRADGFGGALDQGGGGLLVAGGGVTVRSCSFLNNVAGLLGGGAFCVSATSAFDHCAFVGNSVLTANGGGVAAQEGHVSFQDCVFKANSTSFGFGGAFAGDAAVLTMLRCLVDGNSGSAVSLSGGAATIRASKFTANDGTSGGALLVAGPLSVEDCTFSGNFATGGVVGAGRGGAAAVQGATTLMVRCRFHGNVAQGRVDDGGRGGAVHVSDGTVVLAHGVFTGNAVGSALITSRDGGFGAAACVEPPGTLSLAGCTVAFNHADTEPGGLNGSLVGGVDGPAALVNTILCNNSDSTGLGEEAQVSALATLAFCCVDGWSGALGGAGNFAGPTTFVDADGADDLIGTEDDDLRLAAGTGCIDAGANAGVAPDALDEDGDGVLLEPLPLDLSGVARLADDLDVPDTGSGPEPIVDVGAYERSAWTNLGHALAGTKGEPLGLGLGSLGAVTPISGLLTSARPNTLAWLLGGGAELNQPFKGGVLVPNPFPPGFAVPLLTDASGTAESAGTWPPVAVSGLQVWFQFWLFDPEAGQGAAASNAFKATSP